MGFLDRLKSNPPVRLEAGPALPVEYREITEGELLTEYEILDANDEYVIVVPASQEVVLHDESVKQLSHYDSQLLAPEIGSTGLSTWNMFAREEYNAELRDQNGLRKYDRMRRSDASVRAALRLFKTPILAARWFVQPYSQSPKDVEIAEHVHNNLFHYMSISWTQLLWESLLMLDFGYYMFEKVYGLYDGKIIWTKFAPRHPMDVEQWKWDAKGGPDGVIMNPGSGTGPGVYIPIEKLSVFSFDREAGDLRGISALRSAYKHWYFKENLYKIDAIQKERHGVGVPIIKLPPGFTDTDKRIAHELGRNLRSNEKAHVVLPPFWEVLFAKLEGQHVDALASAEHHSNMIFQNILGEFAINDGASNEVQHEMFLKSARYVADIIRDVFNMHCIPHLVDMNYDVEVGEYPELRVRRLGDTQDWRMISFALRNLIGANIIKPDDKLDEWTREEMDLPRADPSSVREVSAPQSPGAARVGMPRQAPPGQRPVPKDSNAGKDSSGKGNTNAS